MLSSAILVHHYLVSRWPWSVVHIENWQWRISRDTYHVCKILESSVNFVFGAKKACWSFCGVQAYYG